MENSVNMTNEREAKILEGAIAKFGTQAQIAKAVEELNELCQALARDIQGQGDRANIAEEMADVYIMLGQLQLIYGNRPEIAAAIRDKLGRTMERVESERMGKH